MRVPDLAPGKRFTLPRPHGSADALLLARHAAERLAKGAVRAPLAVCTAEPADAQRLADEIGFFEPKLRIAVFPDWETLPYDTFSPHQDLVSERLATLARIARGEVDVVLMAASTALVRLAPPSFLAGYTFSFKVKERLDEAALKAQLTLAGYEHVSQVVSPGEYAVRGSLIDLFPMGSPMPYRVDLFGDEIDSIRTFDPDSQRSLYPVPSVRMLPGREFPMDEAARTAFRSRWRERIEGDPTKSRVYKDIGAGLASAGIEYYLPLFFDQTATVFEHHGPAAGIVLHGDVDEALQRFWTDHARAPPLPAARPRAADPRAGVPCSSARGVLRRRRHAPAAARARDRRRAVDRTAARPLVRARRARAARAAEGAHRQDDAARAHRGGERGPAREPARAAARQPNRAAERRVARRVPDRRRAPRDRRRAARAGLRRAARAGGTGLEFVTETELFAASPAARRRKRQQATSDVEALIKDLSELKVGDPSCTSTTASAATAA